MVGDFGYASRECNSSVSFGWSFSSFSFRGGAFALLGPLQSWQVSILGYGIRDEIGGPQNLGEEYRWNVPVITYAFDSSFVDFFGTNGERAVEEALGMITNALGNGVSTLSPLLEEFPLRGKCLNQRAAALGLIDLKTYTLGFILEEMGLAGPEKYSWILRGRSTTADTSSVTNYVRITRNFDPIDLQPTSWVNGVFYTSEIYQISVTPEAYDAIEFPVDPTKPFLTSAASIITGMGPAAGVQTGGPDLGEYFSSLTRDDVGGLRYLLSTNNINMEDILPDITAVDSANIVHAAPRPGLDKIAFQRFSMSDGTLNNTNVYVDTFLSNGFRLQQQVRRTITRPDITFYASDLGTYESSDAKHRISRRADWLNGSDSDGPGIIKPGIQINFGKLGPNPTESYNPRWGAFDDSQLIVIFPAGPSYQIPSIFRLTQLTNETNLQFLWELNGIAGVDYRIEKSDDLQQWTAITNINAINGTFSFQFEVSQSNTNLFYRALRN